MFFSDYCEVFQKVLFKEHDWWLLLQFKFVGHLMTYVNWKIDGNIILCVSIMYFFASVLLKLLKYVKLIVFENYMNAKQNMFLIKKLVTQFDERKSDMTEKEH